MNDAQMNRFANKWSACNVFLPGSESCQSRGRCDSQLLVVVPTERHQEESVVAESCTRGPWIGDVARSAPRLGLALSPRRLHLG